MNRVTILARVNNKVHEGLYSYEDIVDELDDSIDRINDVLSAEFPYFSEVLTDDEALYTDDNGPIFPFRYIRTVCIPYVAAQLMRREDEFGSLYQTHMAEFDNNLQVMFRDFYNDIPEEYQKDEKAGVIAMNPGPVRTKEYDVYAPHNWGPTPDEEED